jgi:HK97 family phage major capsid protein
MNRKQRLNARLLRLKAKAKALDERAAASTDAAEVRDLTEQRADVQADIDDVTAEIAEIEEQEKREKEMQEAEARQTPPATAQVHNAGIVASFAQNAQPTQSRDSECVLESTEYRRAFMNYVQRGTPIPADLGTRVAEYRQANPLQYRAGEAIDTTDTGAAIPLTIMREIINTVRKKYGNLYDRVTKLSVQGGVEFPIGELQADFEWITESTVSPEKEIGKLGTISFKYNTAEIRIAQTFLSSILTMEAFESKITEVIALAYRKAMDIGIVKGTGNGQMLGILNDIRVTGQVGHTIAMTAAEINNWTAWRKKFFAKLPLGYRDGEFIFSMATVDAYLETMADSNNNPIFRQATGLEVNDGDAADPNGRFFGRRISIVEPDIITDFDSASSNDVIGIYWQPSEYAINENFGFMMRRYYDENRNKWINKALTVVDGKVLNPNGFYLITKA